jgi:hypothetical protein
MRDHVPPFDIKARKNPPTPTIFSFNHRHTLAQEHYLNQAMEATWRLAEDLFLE